MPRRVRSLKLHTYICRVLLGEPDVDWSRGRIWVCNETRSYSFTSDYDYHGVVIKAHTDWPFSQHKLFATLATSENITRSETIEDIFHVLRHCLIERYADAHLPEYDELEDNLDDTIFQLLHELEHERETIDVQTRREIELQIATEERERLNCTIIGLNPFGTKSDGTDKIYGCVGRHSSVRQLRHLFNAYDLTNRLTLVEIFQSRCSEHKYYDEMPSEQRAQLNFVQPPPFD